MDKLGKSIVNRYGGYVYGMYLVYKQNRSRIALNVQAVRSFFEDFGYDKVSVTRARKLIQLVRQFDSNAIVVPRMPLKRGRPKKGEPPRPPKPRRPRKPRQRQLVLPLFDQAAAPVRVARNLTVRENIENCQKATEWLEFVAEITYSTVPYVRAKLNEFRIHLGAYALDDPRPAREFKKHFVNWLKQERRRPAVRMTCLPASALDLYDRYGYGYGRKNNNNNNPKRIMITRDNDMRIAYAALRSGWVREDTYHDNSRAFYSMMRLGLFEVNGYTREDMRRDAMRIAYNKAYSELDTNSELIKLFIRRIRLQGKTVEDVITVLMGHILEEEQWSRRPVVA